MTDMLTQLATRRSIAPQFMTGRGPTPDELTALLTVATRVPDHGRLFPWRIILFEGEARTRAGATIEALYRADHPAAEAETLAFERNRLARAPLVIGVISQAGPHAKIPEWEQVLSAGAVCMSILTAARAMGFAACWLTEWMAYDRRFLDSIGVRASERVAGFVHVGMSETVPKERDRPDLSKIVTRF